MDKRTQKHPKRKRIASLHRSQEKEKRKEKKKEKENKPRPWRDSDSALYMGKQIKTKFLVAHIGQQESFAHPKK
jgi:hypothetical protein